MKQRSTISFDVAAWLGQLIRIPSLPGYEEELLQYLTPIVAGWAPEVLAHPFPANTTAHPEYRPDGNAEQLPNRRNLILRWPGSEQPDKVALALNTHLDVVPWDDWPTALNPELRDGRLYGRGACDCKGQVTLLALMVQLLGGLSWQPRRTLEIHLVVEEETGGSGSLATILGRPQAAGVIVLEPTCLQAYCANRGALWFRADIEGRSTHMGRKWEGVNAIELAADFITSLRAYEQRLIEESRGVALFEHYPVAVQVNVGMINGGDWPAKVAGSCTIEGGVGYLPNKNREIIRQELEAVVAGIPNPWLREHTRLSFEKIRNEAYVTPAGDPLVTGFSQALAQAGLDATPRGWNVSCDARLYAHVGGMPAIVFGAGDIAHAHAAGEHVPLQEIETGAQVLAQFVDNWCRQPW